MRTWTWSRAARWSIGLGVLFAWLGWAGRSSAFGVRLLLLGSLMVAVAVGLWMRRALGSSQRAATKIDRRSRRNNGVASRWAVWRTSGRFAVRRGRNIPIERRRRDAEAVRDLGHADVGIGKQCSRGFKVVFRELRRTTSLAAGGRPPPRVARRHHHHWRSGRRAPRIAMTAFCATAGTYRISATTRAGVARAAPATQGGLQQRAQRLSARSDVLP